MAEKSTLKPEGLAFGHALQTAFKIAVMYSVDHPATERAVAQSYALLNKLLGYTQQFTFGFLNKRVMINDLLTDDNTLSSIEGEFFRRSIGAITFSAGITLGEFKRGLAVVATRPKTIEEKGGIQTFVQQNPLTGMRILPAITPESEDTVLQMNPESYLMAQGILGPGTGRIGQGLESLLRFAGMETPSTYTGGAKEAWELANKATQASLLAPSADPRESLRLLVRMLEESSPSHLLSSLSPQRQAELTGRTTEEIAQSLVEDLTVDLAARRLGDNPDRATTPVVQEQVVQILTRGLQATHVAERLLQKLSRVIEESHLPSEVFDRIRQEVMWVQLDLAQKHAHLLRVERFDDQEFHRLINYAQESMNTGRNAEVAEVVEHYMGFLDRPGDKTRAHELSRVPQLLPAVSSGATLPLLQSVAARLTAELSKTRGSDRASHQQVANCLATASQTAAVYEDYATVHKIGSDLDASLASDNARHSECCGRALDNLLTGAAFERVIELYVAKRGDLAWAKVVGSLAKWIGPKSGEVVFTLLEKENSAPNRLRLVRMCAPLLGRAAREAAVRRLGDERWYVVRNACTVLGELGDPETTSQLSGALRHADDRVQQAAVTAIIRCKGNGRAAAFAQALPHLKAQVLDMVLDELIFLKDPKSVEGLKQFVLAASGSRTGALEKAVSALATIGTAPAVEILGKVVADTAQAAYVRNAALLALGRNSLPSAKQAIAEFIRTAPNDPLAVQANKILAS